MRAQPLAERVLRDQLLELADELRVAAGLEVGRDPLLEHREAQLLQTGHGRQRERLVGEVGQRLAPPELERLAKGYAAFFPRQLLDAPDPRRRAARTAPGQAPPDATSIR